MPCGQDNRCARARSAASSAARNLGREFDYHAAVAYSETQGWLKREMHCLRLTRGGFAEM